MAEAVIPDPVRALAKVWRDYTYEPDFPLLPDHCVNGTRIATAVLEHFDVAAEPVSCRWIIFNRRGFSAFQIGMPLSAWPPDAWSVGVADGHTAALGKWNGHLVTEGDDWTLDLSARQFHRDNLIDIDRPSMIPGRLPREEWQEFVNPDGTVIVGQRWPENTGWVNAPGWQWTEHNQRVRDEVIARMEKELT